MTFATIEQAQGAARRYHSAFGCKGYSYRLQQDSKGYLVAVYSELGNFLTYV